MIFLIKLKETIELNTDIIVYKIERINNKGIFPTWQHQKSGAMLYKLSLY